MGQAHQYSCRDGLVECRDFIVSGSQCADQAGGRINRLPLPEPPPADAEWLFAGVPRELAEALRETGQWMSLRRRPWLSAAALRGLQRNLQQCRLREVAERYREAEAPDECTYDLPPLIRWAELDPDHLISAGQVFRLPDMPADRLSHFRRVGLHAIRQNKVAVAFFAGGANLRLGCTEAPVGCQRKALGLRSGKSILQLLCERVRRIAALAYAAPGELSSFNTEKKLAVRASIPVFVVTSRLTHRAVLEHFEASNYFGLPPRDVLFFEQPVLPVVDDTGQLLPQSLGGEVALMPGGTGQALYALAHSSALERMRDRGVECLHVLGTENLLAKVCDPVFLGFCRDLDIECACKVVERLDPAEDLELFCVRQSPVSSAWADIEEAACGLDPAAAPADVVLRRTSGGELSFHGSINSVFLALSYIEEAIGRQVRPHMLARPVPFLDFHVESTLSTGQPEAAEVPSQEPWSAPPTPSPHREPGRPPLKPPGGVAPGCWPAESVSLDLTCQRALLTASTEVRGQRNTSRDEDPDMPWRCDVHLDCGGPLAVVRVRSARPGPYAQRRSLRGAAGDSEAAAAASAAAAAAAAEAEGVPAAAMSASEWLRCSLVLPGRPNAWVLETSMLDYFAFTDRAVAMQVSRSTEFAPVRDVQGLHTALDARRALHSLHCSWLLRAGKAVVADNSDSEAILEVSPLVSYDGEGLERHNNNGALPLGPLQLPLHVGSPEEMGAEAEAEHKLSARSHDAQDPDYEEAAAIPEEFHVEGLDTRPFYLQEYPLRPEVSCSHVPRFRPSLGVNDVWGADEPSDDGFSGLGNTPPTAPI